MSDRGITQFLAPVRSRQRVGRAGRCAAWGLVPAALAAAALGGLKLAGALAIGPAAILAVLAAGPVLGALAGLLWPASWGRAAAAVDNHYGLKDRAATALTLSDRGETPWAALQKADAAQHLARVEPRAVVPFRPGRRLALGSLAAAAVVALAVWPAPRRAAAETAGPDRDLQTVAAEVVAEIDRLEEEVGEEPAPEIEELLAELRAHAERLQDPATDAREALAELSRMEEAIRQRSDYDAAAVTANLQSLASAMESAEALRPAAEALKGDDLEQAARQLEEAAPADAPRRERKAAAERMKQAAKKMSESGQGALSGATGDMADGLSEGNGQKTSAAARRLASLLRKHQSKQSLCRALKKKLDRLGECKSKCSACLSDKACSSCGSKLCDGNGRCEGSKNSLAKGQGQRSTKASTNYGLKTAGNVDDPATGLGGNRDRQELTGVAGEGPSEFETSNSPEGEESARRGYAERFADYQKRSEEVLEAEDIPLGHRRLIRDYFESIRPSAAESAALDAAE